MDPIDALRQQLAERAAQMDALVGAAAAIGRPMNADEQTKFDALNAEITNLESSIKAMERNKTVQADVLGRPAPRAVAPADGTPAAPRFEGGTPNAWNATDHNFKRGVGEWYNAVRNASYGRADERLKVAAAVTTWGGSQDPASVGYAMPSQFVQGIMSLAMPADSFLRALSPVPTDSDLIQITTDEDAPWSTSGVTAAKTAEGGAITASKPATKRVSIVMYGVKSLVHMDERTIRNQAFMGAYVQRKMGEKIRWKLENYVMNGTGEGEPLGLLNAPGKVAVTDIASNSTGLGAEDIALMEATALTGAGGFWVIHPLVKAQVRFLKTGTNGYPLYATSAREGMPVDQLLGYPLYTSEAAKPYNTEGDITFAKPDGYVLALESGGIKQDTTIYFAFDQNLESFRSTLYMGGAPTLSGKVLRADGTNYASNIVTLAGSRS